MKKNIAIVGAGFFGISAALVLSKKHNVTIFDKSDEILSGASKKNQLRFHRGYHYPRSIKTLIEIKEFSGLFLNFFGKNVIGSTINYYGVAKKNSKTSYKKYLNFLNSNKLTYNKYSGKYFNLKKISGTIISKETNLNFFKIKKKINNYLEKTSVKLKLNTKFRKSFLIKYDKIIIACYDQNNSVLNDLGLKIKKKYRYELIEKIIIKLPSKFYNKSFMVIDGEFVSLDPYLGTKYHLFSDVENSKIEIIKKGYFPRFKDPRARYLSSGIINNIKISNFKKFIKKSSQYLPFLENAEYIGSYFVTRCLNINKEKTDERLNSILKHNKKIYSVHSGKWNTCIGLAKKITSIINND
jgi:D-amino-acid oxidase